MTLNLPIETICKKYQDGMNTVSLGKEYGCSSITIMKRLRDNNVRIRSMSEVHKGLNIGNDNITYINLPIDEICRKYLAGISTADLAAEYGCSTPTIIKRLRDNDIKIRSLSEIRTGLKMGENNPRYVDLPIDEICERYLNGISMNKLAKEYGCDMGTIGKRLRDNEVKIRSPSDARKGLNVGEDCYNYVKLPIQEVSKKYLDGMTTVDLAEEYGCSIATITKKLSYNNVEIRKLSGMKHTLKSRIHMSAGKQGIPYDEWKEFSKEQKYCYLFNLPLKEAIRLYFDNNCFMDNEPEENGRALCIHHVNFDKRCGCDATQFCIFVPVKNSWNIVFNGNKDKNRWYWYSFLMNKIFIEHPNYFTYHIPVWGMCELEYNYNYVFEKFRR